MAEGDVRDQLTGFIVSNYLFGDDSRLPGPDESLMEAGVIDSTGILELIEFLEPTFGIEVPEEETLPQNLDTIDALVAFIGRKQAAAS